MASLRLPGRMSERVRRGSGLMVTLNIESKSRVLICGDKAHTKAESWSWAPCTVADVD